MTRVLAALSMLLLVAASAPPAGLRVMTVNVRVPLVSDGANAWPHRRALLARTIADADADAIGTQELHAAQAADIVRANPRYAWFGRDRRGGRDDEHMGVFYRRDRLRLLARGDFWLSDTPAVPGSISWGHPYPRMVTWGRFRTREGRTFTLFNTHLPYRGEDGAARAKAALLIAARIGGIRGPVVLTGDFNAAPDEPAHAILTAGLSDAWEAAPRREGPAATFHGFTGKGDRRIDWVLVRGLGVWAARTLDAQSGGRFPSDHFPVVVVLDWR